jgi:hypothetical protein
MRAAGRRWPARGLAAARRALRVDGVALGAPAISRGQKI